MNNKLGIPYKKFQYKLVANNTKARSHSNFKLSNTNIGIIKGINTIPLYMTFLIK